MFRNSYLDTYKHAVLYNKEVEFLFVHLSHIYTTLGSVINDIEYQFGLILSKAHESEISPKNIPKSSYGSKPPENSIKTEVNEMQNKLENYHNLEINKFSSSNFEYKPTAQKEKEQTKPKHSHQIESSEKRNEKERYLPIIESTQDFDNLFLNPKEEQTNQNSNTRQQPKQPSRSSKEGSSGNNQKMSLNKISDDKESDFMDRLFRN